jgi:hypothetical protein
MKRSLKPLVLLLLKPLAFGLCAALLVSTAPHEAATRAFDEDPFALELPEIGPQRIKAPQTTIPHINLSQVKLYVNNPVAGTVRYGDIFIKINGESAGTIFDKRAGANGYVCIGDISSKPRFKLQPGKNVIEILARAKGGREYYASYVLLTGAGGALAAAEGAESTIESVPIATGSDRTPPRLFLTQPNDAIRLVKDTGTVKVVGVATDEARVASVSINGTPVKLSPAAGTRGLSVVAKVKEEAPSEWMSNALEFAETIAIDAKASALIVEARDQAGNLTRLSLPVRRREALVSEKFQGRKFALVVGVSRYKFAEPGFSNLAYADADARSVRDFLARPEGGAFRADDIIFLENERATTDAVRAALTTFLTRAAATDLIFIFIAGHGGPDPYAPQNLYFMLHNSKPADMPNTALPMSELQDVLDHRLLSKRVIVFVDTCHSAGLSGEKIATRSAGNNLINLYVSRLYSEEGRAVLTSSDVNEVSRESTEYGGGHGVFTWALLEGLGGGADADDDRLVTAGELFGYVRSRVQVATGFRQNPRALPGLNGNLALAAVRGK